MLRKGLVVRFVALAAIVVLVGSAISEAQGRRQPGGQRGNRQRGGNRMGRGGGSIAILKNEYLQKELNFTAAQKKRVNEIDLQMAGMGALQREDVQKALGITPAQKEKMASVQTAQRTKMRELFGGFGRGNRGNRGNDGGNRKRPNFEELGKKMREMREESNKATLAVLTATQVATFERMKGKKVDLEKLRGGGRRPAPKRPEI